VSLTPREIEQHPLKSRRRRYERESVDAFLARVASSYEQVWRERHELRERVAQLESDEARQEAARILEEAQQEAARALEDARQEAAGTLEGAQQEAAGTLDHAREEAAHAQQAAARALADAQETAARTLEEARAKSEETSQEAARERERVGAEVSRLEGIERELQTSLRALLLAGLELVEAGPTQEADTRSEDLKEALRPEEPSSSAGSAGSRS
jgi:cell division septum initiation protein DivIVA